MYTGIALFVLATSFLLFIVSVFGMILLSERNPGERKQHHIYKGWRLGTGLLLGSLLTPLMLNACGDISATPSQPTRSISASPSATLEPTPTFAPTSTSIPPSPTPVPMPNKLLLGSESYTWGEIIRYQPAGKDRLVELAINQELLKNLGNWFEQGPQLRAVGAGVSNGSNIYAITVKPEIAKGLSTGSLTMMNSLEGGVRGIVVDNANTIRSQVSLQPISGIKTFAVGLVAFQVMSFITAQGFLSEINQQLEALNRSINEIKDFLQQKERSALLGNLQYLDNIRVVLNEQKVSDTNFQDFRTQLENIERETLAAMIFAKGQTATAYTTYKETRIDKGFLTGTRDETKIDDFQKIVDTYKRESRNYYLALSVRGLAAQITSALPQSRDVALSRLEMVQKDLAGWREDEIKFYDEVTRRLPEMDGTLTNPEKQMRLGKQAEEGKTKANENYTNVNSSFSDTVQKVKAQIQEASQPLTLIVEFDSQGKVKKVSKLLGV